MREVVTNNHQHFATACEDTNGAKNNQSNCESSQYFAQHSIKKELNNSYHLAIGLMAGLVIIEMGGKIRGQN